MVKKIPCREKSGNWKFCWKSGKNQGISKNLIFVRSKYSNFIAVQMWLLVVSFCHMLKIPADLILLKGGVLVRWSTCLLYILFFSFSHSKVDILLQTQCLSLNFDAKIYIILLHNQLISRLVLNLKILVFIPTPWTHEKRKSQPVYPFLEHLNR